MNTIYSFGDPVLYAGHHAIVLASYTCNEYEVAFTDKIGDGPGYWKTAIAKREELQAHRATMTPDTIERQARREAEAKYFVKDYFYPARYAKVELQREAYAAALISERSKPQPSVEEVMEVAIDWDREWNKMEPGNRPNRWDYLRDRLTKLFNP